MRSKIPIVIVLAALLLSACQPAQTSTLGETGEPTETSQPMPGCRVTGSQLEPNPTLVALFPAVSEKDWVIGPSDARVTILEFSDFQ
jgi:protein-disulfide isomerase